MSSLIIRNWHAKFSFYIYQRFSVFYPYLKLVFACLDNLFCWVLYLCRCNCTSKSVDCIYAKTFACAVWKRFWCSNVHHIGCFYHIFYRTYHMFYRTYSLMKIMQLKVFRCSLVFSFACVVKQAGNALFTYVRRMRIRPDYRARLVPCRCVCKHTKRQ